MKTNYQLALDYLEKSKFAGTVEEAMLYTAQAQVYATLAGGER